MRTIVQTASERTHQAEHTASKGAPPLTGQQAAFDDQRAETAGLQALQTTLDVSQRQQVIRPLQQTMNASPRQHQLQAAQANMNGKFKGQAGQLQAATAAAPGTVGRSGNHTGLPDPLKAGIESLSGMSMDHVKVHYDSAKPAQLQAHAYAQGSEIHVGPGQEQHLPHEAWHVVQQAQGRVKPTVQMKGGMSVNDDEALEAQADVMGAMALQRGALGTQAAPGTSARQPVPAAAPASVDGPTQLRSRYESAGADRVQTAIDALAKVAEEIPAEKLSAENVQEGMRRIDASPIDYGVFDLGDEQHVIKLYYDIRKQLAGDSKEKSTSEPITEQEKKAATAAKPDTNDGSFDVAFLGAGASIAYDIVSRGTGFDRTKGIIIGPLQPWAGDRGPGVVAHPEHMISPIRHFLGSAIDDTWLRRDRFSDLIREVFIRSEMKWVHESVSGIEKSESGGYRITIPGDTVLARNVVSGIGVGAHLPPAGVAAANIASKQSDVGPEHRVMSMDVFTQVAGKLKKDGTSLGVVDGGSSAEERAELTVVLSGANGGIDVAFDALNRGYTVDWIVGNTGARFLPGFPNYAAYLPYLKQLSKDNVLKKANVEDYAAEKEKVETVLPDLYGMQDAMFDGVVDKFKAAHTMFKGVHFGRVETATPGIDGVSVTIKDGPTLKGDIMVYAQGQGGGNFELFKEFLPELKPERDRNRRFTDGGDAALGLTTDDNSLKIVGAMAYRLGATIEAKSGEMVAVLEALDGAITQIRHAWAPEFQTTTIFHAAFSDYARLIDAVRAVETKKDGPNTAQRAKAKTTFDEAMNKVDLELLTFQGRQLSPGRRDAINRLQDAFATARLKSGSIGEAMSPVIASQPNNVLLNDQLTPTRSQIEAVHDFVPFNIGQQANFVTDDRTTVAIHISAKYPALSDYSATLVQELTKCIVEGRKKVAGGKVPFEGVDIPLPTYTPEPPNGLKFQQFWNTSLSSIEKAISEPS